ncbi:unnamed protein product [Peniophora sp. CBMAI 1063]|nr:unnamed protein product [Peniophora sp. CBMAI 1063]
MLADSTSLTPSTPRSRKAPYCQICKRPRKGHPRSGCPELPSTRAVQTAPAVDLCIADALASLSIGQDAETPPTSASLLPSTVTTRDPFMRAKIRERQGRMMPGTLFPPTNSLLSSEPPSPQISQSTLPWNPEDHTEDLKAHTERSPSASQLGSHSPRPSGRSASMRAREGFLDDLDRVATHVPVSVYSVPIADIELLEPSAKEVGFRTATVIPESSATQEDVALLVIGTDGTAVGDVCEKLRKEDAAITKRSGSSRLVQVAGGALVGAAAIWASLAL